MRPGCSTAASAIAHFYAALIRRDGSHLAVLPSIAEWDDTLRYKMTKLERFYFQGARFQGLRCNGDVCEFEIHLTVASGPNSVASSGTDQGVVTRTGNLWLITRPPT